jgi:hypothetical protein
MNIRHSPMDGVHGDHFNVRVERHGSKESKMDAGSTGRVSMNHWDVPESEGDCKCKQ